MAINTALIGSGTRNQPQHERPTSQTNTGSLLQLQSTNHDNPSFPNPAYDLCPSRGGRRPDQSSQVLAGSLDDTGDLGHAHRRDERIEMESGLLV